MLGYWLSDDQENDETLSKICKELINKDKKILDINLLRLIKDCLYDERFSIKSFVVKLKDICIDFIRPIDATVKLPSTLFYALRMMSEHTYKIVFTVDRSYFYKISVI